MSIGVPKRLKELEAETANEESTMSWDWNQAAYAGGKGIWEAVKQVLEKAQAFLRSRNEVNAWALRDALEGLALEEMV